MSIATLISMFLCSNSTFGQPFFFFIQSCSSEDSEELSFHFQVPVSVSSLWLHHKGSCGQIYIYRESKSVKKILDAKYIRKREKLASANGFILAKMEPLCEGCFGIEALAAALNGKK